MSTANRVAVTGIGCISAAGTGLGFWKALIVGRSALTPIESFDGRDFGTPTAGTVSNFEATDFIERRIVNQTDRHTHFGLVAAQLALDDAGIKPEEIDPTRVGVVMSNNLGGSIFGEEELAKLHTKGKVGGYMAIAWFYAATIGQISIRYGFRGYSKTHIAERAGAIVALGDALRAVQRGDLDVCLAGGCEAPISPYALLGYKDAGLLSPTGSYAPFDRKRDGLVLGEGGAVLVLESWEHATRRGARIYAELSGYGSTCDAVDYRSSAQDGVQYARAIRLSLADARVNLPDVGLAVVDASAGREEDIREARALRLAFGPHADHLMVACPKAIFGHTFGAAGAFDAAIACYSLYNRAVPPIRSGLEVDPECNLLVVVDRSPFLHSHVAVVTGTGRGGINASLVARTASE